MATSPAKLESSSTSPSGWPTSRPNSTSVHQSASANAAVAVLADDHPLSPELSLVSKRTSYFSRPSPSLLPSGDATLFGDDEPEEAAEVAGNGEGNDRELEVATPKLAAVPGITTAGHGTSTTTIRLPEAPHLMDPHALSERLQQDTGQLDTICILQELSRQLSELQSALDQQKRQQTHRESALLQLLNDVPPGGVTAGMLERALTRASVDAAQETKDVDTKASSWRLDIRVPAPKRDTRTPAKKPPISEDLRDAMSDDNFREATLLSASPTISLSHKGRSTVKAKGSGSAASTSSVPILERRGRRASQSLSSRLFGSHSSPSNNSSPTSHAFKNTVASSAASFSSANTASEVSPPLPGQSTKPRADSIRSVASNTSSISQSKGIASWAGNLWNWKTPPAADKGKDGSDEDEVYGEGVTLGEEIGPHDVSVTRQNTVTRAIGSTPHVRQHKRRPRTLSKSSTTSTSAHTADSGTAATSFSSVADQDIEDEDLPSYIANTSIQQSRCSQSSRRASADPASALLNRRASGLYPDAALVCNTAATPVSASATLDSLPPASASLRSTISTSNLAAPPFDRALPYHFRAVSESASTLGKSKGKLIAQDVFRAPDKVSENVNQWTHRLLCSFKPPTLKVSPTVSASPTSAELIRASTSSSSSSTETRPTSPYMAHTSSKGALSPAAMDRTPPTSITLFAAPVTAISDACNESVEEAVPLAPSTSQRPKGYLSSAKGTIGRAFGLSGATPSGNKKNETISPPPRHLQSKQHMSKHRSNSLKSAIEPTLTLPAAFSSFTASSTFTSPTIGSSPLAPSSSSSTSSSNALQMGTIVSAASKPPTLSVDLAHQMKDGPLVDRYGFVYDIKVGMKLLKDSRRKQQQGEAESVISLDTPPVVDFDDLKEAIGPSPAPSPAVETASHTSFSVFNDQAAATAPAASASSPPTPLPSNQSIRRLLSQLGEMNESVEKAQKEAWDAFIKLRKKKQTIKSTKDEDALAAKRRRQTIIDSPLNTRANLDADAEGEQFSDNLVGVASMGTGKEDDKTFRKLVRNGIPIVYRPAIWAEVSGASELREPGVYQDLLSTHAGESSPCLEQIDMDTHRTFPTNMFFAGNGPGVAKLRRVLIAYSWRDPSIGYCQGMNLLAAMLLLVYPDEEDAFWMLASVLEKLLPSDYYSPQLLVSQADQRVLQDLVQTALPELAAHLDDIGVDLPAITFGWFLSIFTDALPIQTLLRVWDVLLVYGPIALFKIAISIFKIHSSEIFATDSASSFYVLLTNLTSHMYSADKLLKTAFDELKFIKRQDIETRRLKHVAEIARELSPPSPSAE